MTHDINYLLISARTNCEKRGLNYELDGADIPTPDCCPVLGITLIYGAGCGVGAPGKATLDRLDNAKGYVRGNVSVISHQANSLKGRLSRRVTENLLAYFNQEQAPNTLCNEEAALLTCKTIYGAVRHVP